MADYDAIIIGAGLGGLTTAALLARLGMHVCVLEKNSRAGGYAVNYTSHGHRFDVATQALGGCGKGGIVQTILSELDLLDDISFLSCEPARVYYFPDDKQPFIQYGFLQDQCASLKEQFSDYTGEIQFCYDVFANIFAELQGISKVSDNPVFGFARNFPALARYSRTTVQDFFDDLQLPRSLQLRLGARAGYCMLPLDRLSLIAFACTEMSYGDGAWMVEGGVSRLVDLLVSFLEKHQAVIERRCRIQRILFKDGRTAGVVTHQGQIIKGSAVVLAADGCTLLPRSGTECELLFRKYQSLERSGSYLVSYYQIPASAVQDLHANIEVRLAEQTLAGKTEIEVYYLLIPSLIDRSSAPDGYHSFCISVPLEDGAAPDRRERLAIRRHLEQMVTDRYPQLYNQLHFLFELGPEHFSIMTGNSNGSAYGFAQTVTQAGMYRLGNNPRVKGLYLAGHWTMPGGGIAGVMTSGQLCAGAVLG
jgi:prolycopene isomerase